MPALASLHRLIVIWACAAAWLALVALAAAAKEADKDFISTPGAAEGAVLRIIEAVGRTPKMLSIDIVPQPLHLGALGDVATIAHAATERAGLEDPAIVTSITIARSVAILPRPSYGDIRWTIEVASPNEAATVYANARGEIVAIDLSRTHRAKTINLLDGDWRVLDAQRALASAVGAGKIVYKVSVGHRAVSVDAVSPDDPKRLRAYIWSLSGVRRGLMDMPNIDVLTGRPDQAAFSFDAVDLTMVPALIAQARQKLSTGPRVRKLN